MARDYVVEYGLLLQETLRGAKVRAFFLGYGSERLDSYLNRRKQKIWVFRNEAYLQGREIHTSENVKLNSELSGLEVKVMRVKL
ncbi:hypothetical protein HYU50_02720 [Candidatus Woesearchaeota archaeon]|nr:hypothetical protein [Candidatus Woesearchaeota archaeon]